MDCNEPDLATPNLVLPHKGQGPVPAPTGIALHVSALFTGGPQGAQWSAWWAPSPKCLLERQDRAYLMPIRIKKELAPTPKTVILHGWRDDPYMGPDRCTECLGWGTRNTKLQNDTVVFRTCPTCEGVGKEA